MPGSSSDRAGEVHVAILTRAPSKKMRGRFGLMLSLYLQSG
jgi:hypothetical protein